MYTLIAYKPEGQDTCCGEVLDSWSGDFQIHKHLAEGQVITLAARYHRKELRAREDRYQLIVHTIDDDLLVICEDLMDDNLQDERFFKIHNEVHKYIKEIKVAEEEEKRNQERIIARNKVLMDELKKSQKEKNERKEFERLKAIYEKPEPKREWKEGDCPCVEISMDPKDIGPGKESADRPHGCNHCPSHWPTEKEADDCCSD